MEVCGTHTMAIARAGLKSLLPGRLKLISGPGCPVCVTDQSYMDQAVMLARGQVDGLAEPPIIATYGDMVRVPGRLGSLAQARSEGAAVHVVLSADQAVELAAESPLRQVVFLGIGFETTAPCTALAILRAAERKLHNFSVLCAHKWIMPAVGALLADPRCAIDALLCPGHVSVILGYRAYEPLVAEFGRPCVVGGFQSSEILAALVEITGQLAAGEARACSAYPAATADGNSAAMALLASVFHPADAAWRAIGVIAGSGMEINEQFAAFDAARRFELPAVVAHEPAGCRCGEVITGRCEPGECGLFGRRCSPGEPIGPCMVSSEGACSAAFKYRASRPGPPARGSESALAGPRRRLEAGE